MVAEVELDWKQTVLQSVGNSSLPSGIHHHTHHHLYSVFLLLRQDYIVYCFSLQCILYWLWPHIVNVSPSLLRDREQIREYRDTTSETGHLYILAFVYSNIIIIIIIIFLNILYIVAFVCFNIIIIIFLNILYILALFVFKIAHARLPGRREISLLSRFSKTKAAHSRFSKTKAAFGGKRGNKETRLNQILQKGDKE